MFKKWNTEQNTRPKEEQIPFCAGKIKLLSEMVGKTEDIPDFGDSFDEKIHKHSLDMICTFMEDGFSYIRTIVHL
ncbi:MAG: hypothetical protein HY981_03135 [Candidatus Magasanikbacteria bacterium]|nr:hypothetical protein [Candidatus Magasanikbacteria bacterium]